MPLVNTDISFYVVSRDLRDYDALPLRWRNACLRMAANHFGMSTALFSDVMADPDTDVYIDRLVYECIYLRLAMGWFVFSDISNNVADAETELRSVVTQVVMDFDQGEAEVNSY